MLDDLIFLGYKYNIPRERPISFLARMSKAQGRYIKMMIEPFKALDFKGNKMGGGKWKSYPVEPIPDHMRPNRRKRT